MVTAIFKNEERYTYIRGLWQWDYGQVLRIQGLKLPAAVEIHFSLQDAGGESLTRIGMTKDGVTDVVIPGTMLENKAAFGDYEIYAFIYLTDESSGQTEYKITMNVKARPKPETFDTPEDAELFREAIAAVNDAAGRAEAASDEAEKNAAQTEADKQSTAADREEVKRLVESVADIDEKVEEIKGYREQSQTAAENALQSEQNAKVSEEAAHTARTGAEAAEDTARTYADQAEWAKEVVSGLGQQIAEDKAHVDKTAQEFVLKAQQAAADVTNAGQGQVERIRTAGNTAIADISTAKDSTLKLITDEGEKQTGLVAAEGEKQVGAVQQAASEIVADREQINANAEGIEELKEVKADKSTLTVLAIKSTSSGNPVVISDSADWQNQGIKIFGESMQNGTPSIDNPVEIKDTAVEGLRFNGKNLLDDKSYQDKDYTVTQTFKKGTYYVARFFNDETDKNINSKLFIKINDVWKVLTKGLENITVEGDMGYGATKQKFTLDKDYEMKLNITSIKDKNIDVSISVNDYLTDYEPYKEQSVTLSQPITLHGIGDMKDTIEERDGGYGVVRNIVEVVLNGSENWRIQSVNDKGFVNFRTFVSNNNSNVGLSDKFIYNSAGISDVIRENIYISGSTLYLRIHQSRFSTVEELKAWLSTDNVTVMYITDATFEPLPEIDQQAIKSLMTYYPYTVISAGAETEVKYIADTKIYIDNKFKELNTALANTQAQLL